MQRHFNHLILISGLLICTLCSTRLNAVNSTTLVILFIAIHVQQQLC